MKRLPAAFLLAMIVLAICGTIGPTPLMRSVVAVAATPFTWVGGVTVPSGSSLTLGGVTGSTQCIHVNSSGVASGTGQDCGVGGGGGNNPVSLAVGFTPVPSVTGQADIGCALGVNATPAPGCGTITTSTGASIVWNGATQASIQGLPTTGSIAGINCRLFTVFYGATASLCGDTSFNWAAAGAFYQVSSRAEKRDIRPLPFDALTMIDHLRVRAFCYRAESPEVCDPSKPGTMHYSIIAEDSPVEIAGPNHNHVAPLDMASLDADALRELHAQVRALTPGHEDVQHQLDDLRDKVTNLQENVEALWTFVIICGIATSCALIMLVMPKPPQPPAKES